MASRCISCYFVPLFHLSQGLNVVDFVSGPNRPYWCFLAVWRRSLQASLCLLHRHLYSLQNKGEREMQFRDISNNREVDNQPPGCLGWLAIGLIILGVIWFIGGLISVFSG